MSRPKQKADGTPSERQAVANPYGRMRGEEPMAREIEFGDKPKGRWERLGKPFLIILAAALVHAVGTYCFVSPNQFTRGGVVGIALIIEYVTGINVGYFTLLFNIPLLLLATRFLDRHFIVTTALMIGLSSAMMIAIEQIAAVSPVALVYVDSTPAILAAVVGGLLNGVGLALMLRLGGTTGGSDIVAAVIQKRRPHYSTSWLIFIFDSMVIVASFFVYRNGLLPVLLALVSLFSSSFVSDAILKGTKSALKAEIITRSEYADTLSQEIIAKLGHTCTKVEGEGMYAHSGRSLLICVIQKRQIGDLRRVLGHYDDTFTYVSQAAEIYGMWKRA